MSKRPFIFQKRPITCQWASFPSNTVPAITCQKRCVIHQKRPLHVKRDPSHVKRDLLHVKRDISHIQKDLSYFKRDLLHVNEHHFQATPSLLSSLLSRLLSHVKRDALYVKRAISHFKRDLLRVTRGISNLNEQLHVNQHHFQATPSLLSHVKRDVKRDVWYVKRDVLYIQSVNTATILWIRRSAL